MSVPSEEKQEPKRQRSMVRFAIVLISCFTAFAVAYFMLRRSDALTPFLAFNASLASSVVNLFGASVRADGVIISSGSRSFQVITECTSLIPTAILFSAVLAWQSSVREKVIGLVLGTFLLFLINTGRIISLLYIGEAFPGFLDIAHFFIWQGLLILITVGLWVFWAAKMVRP